MPHRIPLEISNVFKSFNNQVVLKNINFSLVKGEIFGLIGLNGVGKTTLIKIILDLLDADSGEIKLFSLDSKDPNSRQNLAYLPEKFYPSQFLKGKEFLNLSQEYYKKDYNEERAIELSKKLDLDPRMLNETITKYSKGMGQKLGLLSMLMCQAPLLILDEPMSGLDPSARIQLKELLLNYKRDNNTIFFSSHILSDIDEICDRIAILSDSEIIFVGSPADFRSIYNQSSLEKAFLKAINKATFEVA